MIRNLVPSFFLALPYPLSRKLRLTLTFLLLLPALSLNAQDILQKKVTVQASRKPVREVLKDAEEQGGFYFSYNNNIIHDDSLVTLSIRNRTVSYLLETLFGSKYQYHERNNYLIIQPAVTAQYWYVSGIVVDRNTGERISNATVYERQQLVSTMTNEQGYFRLQLKEHKPSASISVSKISYSDTLILLSSAQPEELMVSISPVSYTLDSIVISSVEKNWLSNMFLSSRQTMNSVNLSKFFADKPYQFSFTPGLGSHGRMGAQVINKFSFNLLGGYTAGVEGFEIAGLFNIVKKDMRYAQIGGVFNIVGGSVVGFQIGGLYNHVMDSVRGVQLAGLSSIVADKMSGVQVSGLYNNTKRMDGVQTAGLVNVNVWEAKGVQVAGLVNYAMSAEGLQVAGIANVNIKETNGTQIAGIANVSTKEVSGAQISGMVNYTRKLKGLQIGVINIADTSEGYSIGLVNIILKGYHKLSFSSNESQHLNVSFKTGSRKLYSILMVGVNLDNRQKMGSFGYGLGSDIYLGKKFFFNPELSHQSVYLGNIEKMNLLTRLQLSVKYRVGKLLAIYAGPAISMHYFDLNGAEDGYKSDLSSGMPSVSFGDRVKCWVGWNIGLDIF
jgi:hypothetical protein